MDFTPTDEQVALRDAVRGLLRGYDPAVAPEHRRQVIDSDPGYDEGLWRRLAEMGILGLPFAEADGGMGAGPVEVALVAEEFGRVLAPEPYVATVVLAGGVVAAAGSPEQRRDVLTSVAAGDHLLTFATGPVAEPVIQGARADTVVWHVGDLLYLAARPEDVTGYPTHDGGRAARLEFDPAGAVPLGSADVLPLVLAHARIAACHEALGAMETSLSLTTSYLRTRQQFGVTLNRFQSLTFRAADMYTELELARSLATWAAMVAAEVTDPDEVVTAAARAAVQTAKAARLIGQESIQMHGGIGLTAEYPIAWYTSRLTALTNWLLTPGTQLDRLARTVSGHTVLDPLRS